MMQVIGKNYWDQGWLLTKIMKITTNISDKDIYESMHDLLINTWSTRSPLCQSGHSLTALMMGAR
jgi:hypothetical protein